MNWFKEISDNKKIQNILSDFLRNYGISGLEEALRQYSDRQQEYTCSTRKSLSRIKLVDIYYLKINGHDITIHTAENTYRKYGTLNSELKTLSHYGFIKCNQSYVVSLSKIKTIHHNQIILINHQTIPMSESYAPKVMIAFHNFSHKA